MPASSDPDQGRSEGSAVQGADGLPVRRLLQLARNVVAELDPETILRRVLESARDLTGARYGALGILNEQRTELEHFLTIGIDEQTQAAIGSPPCGRGVLGALIEDPRPLRLADVGRHPRSYGFPVGHPIMKSFLGVPIAIEGRSWGNLYLTEKSTGQFTEADEEAVVILAEWAATALENSRLYHTSEQRRLELEHALRGLEATRDVIVAIGSDFELDHTLELIAKRARALVDARSLLILLPDGPDILIAARAGYTEGEPGRHALRHAPLFWTSLNSGAPLRIADIAAEAALQGEQLGASGARGALLVPLVYRHERLGVLAAIGRGTEGTPFTRDDERLLQSFAVSAAAALAIARNVQPGAQHPHGARRLPCA